MPTPSSFPASHLKGEDRPAAGVRPWVEPLELRRYEAKSRWMDKIAHAPVHHASDLRAAAETYQTNPNHYRYSKSDLLRLTLVVLRFLRVPLMVRTAFLAFLLVTLLAASAAAARIAPSHQRARATISRATPHLSRRAPSHLSHAGSRLRPSHRYASISARHAHNYGGRSAA